MYRLQLAVILFIFITKNVTAFEQDLSSDILTEKLSDYEINILKSLNNFDTINLHDMKALFDEIDNYQFETNMVDYFQNDILLFRRKRCHMCLAVMSVMINHAHNSRVSIYLHFKLFLNYNYIQFL